ncbi:acyltransferase family protein [Microbulbifer sp. JMSA008]|uniref:acyltransferase family protein n=1 Tax=Microbulbifer sp. JMSA008 TaxID=3243373 RepID=UPI0040390C1F
MKQKLHSLDGLRGVAAFSVILSHIVLAFYPYLHTGTGDTSGTGLEETIFNSPISFFYKGNFAVAIFFVISGYVLSLSFFKSYNLAKLQNSATKRYIRLGIPVFASVMLSWLLISLDFYPARDVAVDGFLGKAMVHSASFVEALKEGVYGAMLFRDRSYNYVLWTIQIELIGSFLLFSFLALFGHFRFGWLIALLICAVLVGSSDVIGKAGIYLSLFILGAYINRVPVPPLSRFWYPIVFMFALYLGGYNWRSEAYAPVVDIAVWIQNNTFITFYWPIFFPCLGALLLVYLIVQDNICGRLLSGTLGRWLGKISFGLYLVHPLVLSSLGLYSFLVLKEDNGYLVASMGAGFITIITSCLVAEIFYRWIDLPTIRWSDQFGKWVQNYNNKSLNSYPEELMNTGSIKTA